MLIGIDSFLNVPQQVDMHSGFQMYKTLFILIEMQEGRPWKLNWHPSRANRPKPVHSNICSCWFVPATQPAPIRIGERLVIITCFLWFKNRSHSQSNDSFLKEKVREFQ